jgi:hypothetical protein
MRDELRSLGVALLTWFTVITGLITVGWFLNSAQPLFAKVVVGVLLLAGAYTIVVFRLGELRGRNGVRVRHSELNGHRLSDQALDDRAGKDPKGFLAKLRRAVARRARNPR